MDAEFFFLCKSAFQTFTLWRSDWRDEGVFYILNGLHVPSEMTTRSWKLQQCMYIVNKLLDI